MRAIALSAAFWLYAKHNRTLHKPHEHAGLGNHSVISEKWHYITRLDGRIQELYDIENDPMEYENLIYSQSESAQQVIAELRQ